MQWVSVDDRLPEVSGDYLASCVKPNGELMTMLNRYFVFGDYYHKHGRWSENLERKMLKGPDLPVTRWMPLPPQSKENR